MVSSPVRLETRGGHTITIDDDTGRIEVRHAAGSRVSVQEDGITLDATAAVEVSAPVVRIASADATFSGVVRCHTLVADGSVLAPNLPPSGPE